jgi:hypothetical protein
MLRTLFVSAILLSVGMFALFNNSYAASNKEAYELQERCGKRAAEYFKQEYGSGIKDNGDVVEMTNYKNHYNKKLNSCFILLTSKSVPYKDEKRGISTLKILYDLNEHQEYAVFFNINKINKPICRTMDKPCNSEDEWDAIAKPYMEE